MKTKWYKGQVVSGIRLGRQFGFPTVNLSSPSVLKGKKKGVYLSKIEIEDKLYFGLLYFGPRLILGEKEDVLEIYVFDFNKEIYNLPIAFSLLSYIRPSMDFPNYKDYRKQLKRDIKEAKKIIWKSDKIA